MDGPLNWAKIWGEITWSLENSLEMGISICLGFATGLTLVGFSSSVETVVIVISDSASSKFSTSCWSVMGN